MWLGHMIGNIRAAMLENLTNTIVKKKINGTPTHLLDDYISANQRYFFLHS